MPRLNTDTKAEIKAVALELFAANGADRTSLREIAERLGITKAALYYHFPQGKAEIFIGLLRRHLRRLCEQSLPQLAVCSYNEVVPGIRVETIGVVEA